MTFLDPHSGIFSLNYSLGQIGRNPQTISSPLSTQSQVGNGSEGFNLTPSQILERNAGFIKPGTHVYNTQLTPEQEQQFRAWVTQNKVPFDINSTTPDYDMRGFWQALQAGDPKAKSAIDPNDKKIHYPDYWKTPYDLTFSNESQWAASHAPKWNEKNQLVDQSGNVVFDDKLHRYYPIQKERSR